MNSLVLAPALGWPVGIAITVVMAACAIYEVVQHRLRSGDGTDETLGMCIRRTAICILIAILALTPSVATATSSRAINGTDVVIATDVTGSMAVDDAHAGGAETMTRLQAAQSAIDDLTKLYTNASFAGISFGKTGTLDVPLTPDTGAITAWARSLKAEPTTQSSGSSLDAGLDQLINTVTAIHNQHPDDRIVLYLITDGEQTTPGTRRTFSSLRQYVSDACVIGVGSTQGAKIPKINPDGTLQRDQYVVDPGTKQDGISKMDVDTIKKIADELSGSYLILGPSQGVDNSVIAQQSAHWRVDSTVKERMRVAPIVWPFAIALAALLAWEMGAWIAMSRKLL